MLFVVVILLNVRALCLKTTFPPQLSHHVLAHIHIHNSSACTLTLVRATGGQNIWQSRTNDMHMQRQVHGMVAFAFAAPFAQLILPIIMYTIL